MQHHSPLRCETSPPLTALSAPPPCKKIHLLLAAPDETPPAIPDEVPMSSGRLPHSLRHQSPPCPLRLSPLRRVHRRRHAQDVSSVLETAQSKDSVMGPEQPTVLPEPPTPPVVPSKTARVAERPQKSQPRRGTSRDKQPSLPCRIRHRLLLLTRGTRLLLAQYQQPTRASAVAPERSAALQESPPPAAPPQTTRNPDRFNPRAVQKERRAAPPVRAGAVSAG